VLTIHHLNNSRSQRILWLLEELGVEYHLEKYQRDAKTGLAPAEMKAVHPLGRSPVLTTDTTTLAESGAIIEFIVRHYGKDSFAKPSNEQSLQQYDFWMHFSEGSLMPAKVALMVFSKAEEKVPGLIRPMVRKLLGEIANAYYRPNLKQSLKYTESHLQNHAWFAGSEPTGADVQMIFPLEAMVATGKAADYPAIKAYVEKVHQRPAYQRALEKGGKYDYA